MTGSDARGPSRRVLIERRLRRRSLKWVLRAREFDRRPRKDPDFVVVGAQKAGSTSLFAYLAAHPSVDQPLVKEINYFDQRPEKGQNWYRRHFPLRESASGHITGEASPMYMVHPLAMDRISRDLPEVKVIAILREPVSRLISHYRHSVRLGHETLSLAAAIEAEPLRVKPDLEALEKNPFHQANALLMHSYVTRSRYFEQIVRIQTLFGDRSFFLRLEDLASPQALRPLCEFLDLEFREDMQFEAHNVNDRVPSQATEPIDPSIIRLLADDGRRTCERLGWKPWRSFDDA